METASPDRELRAATTRPRRAETWTPRPNLLFLMVDQMQGRVLEPEHPCQTPNLDRLAASGVRFRRAYTPNAVCSPARASLMTALLPHNHGVLWVTHNVDADQGTLRTDRQHWAQGLVGAGYRTGYFGKWHVENTESPGRFGWQTDGSTQGELYRARAREAAAGGPAERYSVARYHDGPPGYAKTLHYAVTSEPPERRSMGLVTGLADGWLRDAVSGPEPWCCFVSLREPHDPFVAGEEAFARYDVDKLDLPLSARDDLAGRPGLYAKSARQWRGLTDRELREAMACYYASITEIDELYGGLIRTVEEAGQLADTVVVFTSDHGELLGAHGMYCKNIMASEEVYNIPLVVSGPGVAAGATSATRVGLHDLGATIASLTGTAAMPDVDGRSFAPILADPAGRTEPREGYAEFNGGRYLLTQRILWQDPWKLVFNGFDEDELYNLDRDPYELDNLARDPAYADVLDTMMAAVWRQIEATGDQSLLRSHYPPLRIAVRGPLPVE